eukprot:UC4_evm1s632
MSDSRAERLAKLKASRAKKKQMGTPKWEEGEISTKDPALILDYPKSIYALASKLAEVLGKNESGYLDGKLLRPILLRCCHGGKLDGNTLFQIWSSVDTKRLGKISEKQLRRVLGLISQAQKDQIMDYAVGDSPEFDSPKIYGWDQVISDARKLNHNEESTKSSEEASTTTENARDVKDQSSPKKKMDYQSIEESDSPLKIGSHLAASLGIGKVFREEVKDGAVPSSDDEDEIEGNPFEDEEEDNDENEDEKEDNGENEDEKEYDINLEVSKEKKDGEGKSEESVSSEDNIKSDDGEMNEVFEKVKKYILTEDFSDGEGFSLAKNCTVYVISARGDNFQGKVGPKDKLRLFPKSIVRELTAEEEEAIKSDIQSRLESKQKQLEDETQEKLEALNLKYEQKRLQEEKELEEQQKAREEEQKAREEALQKEMEISLKEQEKIAQQKAELEAKMAILENLSDEDEDDEDTMRANAERKAKREREEAQEKKRKAEKLAEMEKVEKEMEIRLEAKNKEKKRVSLEALSSQKSLSTKVTHEENMEAKLGLVV